MKHEIKDPSTTTEADRALRLRKDLADTQAKLREAEQWREQAARATRLERDLAAAQENLREAEGQANRLSKRPSRRQLQAAEEKLREAEQWRNQASRAARLEREAAILRERVSELEGQVQRLRERPPPRQLQEAVERCAQAKLNRRLFQENERLKQEARNGG